jgi:type VI protein secretion system component Hcp
MGSASSVVSSVVSVPREPAPARRRRNVLSRACSLAAEPLERRDLLAAFLKIEGIAGDSTDPGHDDWILIRAATPIFRSIPGSAVDQQRPRGETSLGEVTFTRQVDRTSPKLMEACALGKFNTNIVVEFTIPVRGIEVPYLKYEFQDLSFASYALHAESSGPATTTETLTLTYKSAELRSFRVNPDTGEQTNEVCIVQAPPTVGLSSTTVADKSRAGTVVGRLSTPHGYTNEKYTYKLVPGAGSRDNGVFKIVGDELRTRVPLNYSVRKSYSIRVQSTASDGSFVVNTFTIGVVKAPAAVRQQAFVLHR